MTAKPALVTSVRDILQERVKAGRNEETVELLNRHFDLVMVHGDPAFATLGRTFPLRRVDHRGDRLYRAGGGAAARRHRREQYEVLVSAGGGAAGKLLVERGRRRRRAQLPGWPRLVPDHRPQPAAGRFRRGIAKAPARTRRSSASARIFRPARRGRNCPCRRPATIRSATYCRPAAARSWFRSPRAARPSRRCARSGCEGLGLAVVAARGRRCRAAMLGAAIEQPAGRAEARLAQRSTSTARAAVGGGASDATRCARCAPRTLLRSA